MRKHEKARLKRIREHQAVRRAIRHLNEKAEAMGLNDKDNTQEDLLALAKSVSNRDLRAIANASAKFTTAPDQEFLDMLISEFTERKMNLERER